MPRSILKEDLETRTAFDFAPYRRSTVDFDHLFNMLETSPRGDDGYPPFDIVKDGEDSYRITLPVAGFRPNEIEVVAKQNQLTVTGQRADDQDKDDYLHRGIATVRSSGGSSSPISWFPARRGSSMAF